MSGQAEEIQETTVAPGIVSRAARLAAMFDKAPVGALIENLETRVTTRRFGDADIPVTINDGAAATCYLCCPSAALIDYARAELRHFARQPRLLAALEAMLRLARPLVAATRLDRQAQANNWLLATNPVPEIAPGALGGFTRALVADWPGHAIVWRSLNDVSDRCAIEAFSAAGYTLFPARQVWLYDCREVPPAAHRDERRDRALLGSGVFEHVLPGAFSPADFERSRLLYQRLYLEKYTWLNPRYTARFLREASETGVVELHGLRAGDGELAGVVGFFDSGDVMTAPVVGYDTSLPAETGLYRMLMAIAMTRARERKLLFNMSAGAGGFKRNRGARPAIEYSAVYNRGLPPVARLAGVVTRLLLERVGVPLLRRHEL